MQPLNNICESITKMNIASQNKRLRDLSRLDIHTKLKIVKSQKQIFHKLKEDNSDIDNTILTLSSLILAIDKITKELDDVTLNVIKLRGKNNKTKIKRQKVLGYWAIVRTLKLKQKMSFRKIPDYLKKHHKFEVSYSTIYNLWNELEKNTHTKEN